MKGLNKRPEYKKIMASLQPNEEIKTFGVAYIGSTDHTIVATNSRVMIVADKLFTKHFDSIGLDNIQSSSLKKGMSGTFLTINEIKLRFRIFKEAEDVYNLLNQGNSDQLESNVKINQETEQASKVTNNQPKKKVSKPLAILGAVVLLVVIFKGIEDKEETPQPVAPKNTEIVDVIVFDQAKHDATLNEQAEERANRDPIIIDIERAVNNNKIITNGTLLDTKINPNLGKNDDSKIVLIYLRWDMKNKAPQTVQMLQMQSARLVNEIGKHNEVSEIVVFWEVPYHKQGSNIAKFNYAKKGNDWLGTAEWFDPILR